MRRVCQLAFQSLALTTLLWGCSTTGLMEATDDMGGSAAGESTSSSSACSACFETVCAWEVTECAAEPACAAWLTCAKNAPADTSGGVSASWLAGSCPDASGPTALALQEALATCITGKSCCEGAAERDENETGAAPGSGGGGGGTALDASAPAFDGNEDGGEYGDETGGWACGDVECTCSSCLYALKHGEMPQETECTTNAQQCLADPACNEFWNGFLTCAASMNEANTQDSAQQRFEACLFLAANGDSPQPHPGVVQFMSTVYPCVTGVCRSYCVVEEAQSCIQCQNNWCQAELEAYLSNESALLGKWCRAYCQTYPEDTDCPGKCANHLQSGSEILVPFGECMQASCDGAC